MSPVPTAPTPTALVRRTPGGGGCPEFPWVPSLMSPPSPGCVRCPAGTEPVLGLEYKWWNVLPPNMETTVLSGINFEYKGMAGTAAPPPPRPHGAGDVTELSPCPRRLGGGRGLHLHGSGSLRQRLHDPDAAGARLQVSASHIPGVPSPPPCRVPTVPVSPAPRSRRWRMGTARRWRGLPSSSRRSAASAVSCTSWW